MSDEVVVEITESQVVEVLLAEGPRGLQGVQGATGLTGADSVVAGPIGLTGLTGDTGETGIVEQATPPADVSVLWLDSSADAVPVDLSGVEPAGLSDETKATLAGTYAPITITARLKSAVLNAGLASANTKAFPTPNAALATVTHGSTATVTGSFTSPMSDAIRIQGNPSIWETTNSRNRLPTPFSGALDFYLTGSELQLAWAAAGTQGTESLWFWVDGVPLTAQPESSNLSTSSNNVFYSKLVFATAGQHRVTIYHNAVAGILGILAAATALFSPTSSTLKFGFSGDSYYAGAATANGLQTAPYVIGRSMGVEVINRSRGGTGYFSAVSGDTFGGAARVANIAAMSPDVIVLSGSLNDSGTYSQMFSAAESAFAAYAVACPNIPLIVFGAQPSGATTTTTAARSALIAGVRDAALAASNVIGFHDMVGTANGVPATFSSGSSYAVDALVVYNGSVWRAGISVPAGAIPGTDRRWMLVTWVMTGTSNSGSPSGDGTRSVFLYSDDVHPTLEGQNAYAIRQAAEIRDDLRAFALA
jgi:hypothetical protein